MRKPQQRPVLRDFLETLLAALCPPILNARPKPLRNPSWWPV